MPTIHVVAFKFKPAVSAAQRAAIKDEFLALKHRAVKVQPPAPMLISTPAGQAQEERVTYIHDIAGGDNTSPEALGKGYDALFVVTFASPADRDYYVAHDPVHLAFAVRTFRPPAPHCPRALFPPPGPATRLRPD